MAIALQARVVFPVDRPPIEHGVVTIEGERIVAVSTKAEAGDVIDLGSVALLPGLVNCHTHLEFSDLRRPLGTPGMRLVDWIRLVIAERGRRDYAPEVAIENGMQESLGYGVTSIGDITTVEMPAPYFPCVDLTLFTEVIAFSLARIVSALVAVQGRLLIQQNRNSYAGRATGDIHFGISPHSPYTVSSGLLRGLVALARERELPVAMHVAESREELELMDSGSGPFRALLEERSMWDDDAISRGRRPLYYLNLLAEAPRALVIHGNYLDDEELQFLGANHERMWLVYCPRTHAYFRHPTYPLAAALTSGVRVALGTDSRASNPDLDLFAEMRHVAKAFPSIEPHTVLRMGTLTGAEALGRDAELGSITPGKLANLVAMPLDEDAPTSANELLNSLFANDAMPSAVWLRGVKV
ncbi:MAG: amidohydrolase family protein [Planctomycetes bacterium]|nr:amidohydrolase family protein [Planctomycetota bacterium]